VTTRARGRLAAVGFIGPPYALYVLFLLVPLLLTVVISFTDWQGFTWSSITFTGLANYRDLAHDPVFGRALLHNLWFVVGSVLVKTCVALTLALVLHRRLPAGGFFQGVFLIPAVLSLVVVGLVFQFILDPNNGLINPLLKAIGLGHFAGAWFGDQHRALPLLVLLDVWVAFGLYLFIYLATLTGLSKEMSEAARVDGASAWQETRYITLPMLRDTTRMVVLLAAIDSLKVFATVYVATGGGPDHASEVLSTWAFFQAFTNNRVGYGNAILVVLLLVTFALAFFYVRSLRADRDGGAA
jgi:ABC-type sugar transport system permease subunit